MSLRIDPQERVLPAVREFDLHLMTASRAVRASRFEYGFWTLASAANSLQNQFVPFVSGYPWRTACLAEGSQLLCCEEALALLRKRDE
jgi:hypothetical protein